MNLEGLDFVLQPARTPWSDIWHSHVPGLLPPGGIMRDIEVIEAAEGAVVVVLHGEHDLLTSDELATCLSAEVKANEVVIVDVTDAELVDASFVHNILRADRLAAELGSRFVLQMGTAPIVRRLIQVSGVLHQLQWAGSREEALEGAPADVGIGAPP